MSYDHSDAVTEAVRWALRFIIPFEDDPDVFLPDDFEHIAAGERRATPLDARITEYVLSRLQCRIGSHRKDINEAFADLPPSVRRRADCEFESW